MVDGGDHPIDNNIQAFTMTLLILMANYQQICMCADSVSLSSCDGSDTDVIAGTSAVESVMEYSSSVAIHSSVYTNDGQIIKVRN